MTKGGAFGRTKRGASAEGDLTASPVGDRDSMWVQGVAVDRRMVDRSKIPIRDTDISLFYSMRHSVGTPAEPNEEEL